MNTREIKSGVFMLAAVDWDRRLFDSLIPLPDGTSYNAYLIKGTEKTAILDSVDPEKEEVLLHQLENIKNVDYIVAHHAEQDHSGAIPALLSKYPNATVFATSKGKSMLIDHLEISGDRIKSVEDGQEIWLGGKTLRFLFTPWVHWPETMCTYVPEDRMLFSCDFFGSHLATSDLYVTDKYRVYEAAKRYYAEIMMPFRGVIKKNMEKIEPLEIDMIAPSHGPVYNEPSFIIKAYKDWISDKAKNLVVLPYVSMHGSTQRMVQHLVSALAERKITVQQFELSGTDLGKFAISLVDAASIVFGTPTVHFAPHPAIFYASFLANALKPKVKFASIIGSYGWGSKAVDKITQLMPNLKVEFISPVLCRGYPRRETFTELDKFADGIYKRHEEAGLTQQESTGNRIAGL